VIYGSSVSDASCNDYRKKADQMMIIPRGYVTYQPNCTHLNKCSYLLGLVASWHHTSSFSTYVGNADVALIIHDSSTWGSGITTTCRIRRSCVAWGVEILKVNLQGFWFLPNIRFVLQLLHGLTLVGESAEIWSCDSRCRSSR
jgi:hypothetical protein